MGIGPVAVDACLPEQGNSDIAVGDAGAPAIERDQDLPQPPRCAQPARAQIRKAPCALQVEQRTPAAYLAGKRLAI